MITPAIERVKERPILFSSEMVRAILEGRKTQTRRVIEHQPNDAGLWPRGSPPGPSDCRYGKPGQFLWVRETWNSFPTQTESQRAKRDEILKRFEGGMITVKEMPAAAMEMSEASGPLQVIYAADFGEWAYNVDSDLKPWQPSIHMPRWASRLTLEITKVRVERLQDISEDDAIAEGCSPEAVTQEDLDNFAISDASPTAKAMSKALGVGQFTAKFAYSILWDELNGKKHPWKSNPWVWCISFRRHA